MGNLTSFILYAAYVGIGFSGVSTFYAETMKALGASSRIWEITDKVPAIPVEGGLVPDKPLKGEIEFQSVAFSYPSRPDIKVLDGLSLKVPSDRVTGIAIISISTTDTNIDCVLPKTYFFTVTPDCKIPTV